MTTPPPLDVLVVDDDPPTRHLVVAALCDAGLQARATANPPPPVPAPRLLLLDLPAPRHDGPGRVLALRRCYPRTRLLVMSGRFDLGLGGGESLARRLGADAVIAKPLDLAALTAAVRRLLSGAAA